MVAPDSQIVGSTEISVVVPAYNEADGIAEFLADLSRQLAVCGGSHEIWVIDDGSRDSTWEILSELQATHPVLNAIRFSRNFGKEAAILAGLRAASGRAVIIMDSDGQHPPATLPAMVSAWRAGKGKIIAATKASRDNDGMLARWRAALFNRTMKSLTGLDLANASDFRLLDRGVVNALLAFPERVRFFRGMTEWTGFTVVRLPFDVAPRIAGRSNWTTAQLTRLAITAMTSFSAKPLGLIFRLGLTGLAAGILLLFQALYSWASGAAVSGWTSITVVIVLFGSANLLGIGVIGAYLAQIFEEIKRRPDYLERERLSRPTNAADVA